ncbi:MAG: ATP-binding protein [Dysgonamonadaceae bacterium]|jgi:predicted AAA+ superfamily ATPase|nr:ATP-binding protein [Dysgonamonadaceae bacterium]
MKIERKGINSLIAWKSKVYRKPLILQGARQVGKTWLLKQFGKTEFEDMAVFNFDGNPDLKQFFANTKDTKRILQNLSLVHGKTIQPQRTLIIFDEIQECNDALNALKYFCEDAPEYCIACAGSLLGVSMSRGASFPVGKVDFMQIYPVSFTEFLAAADPMLANYLDSIKTIEPIPDLFFNQLIDKFKMYYISGGMPEAVVALLEEGDTARVQEVLQAILNAYTLDFSKHAGNKDIPKINYIWTSLPSQLARENKKFLYQTVKPGARARDYEDALLWLLHAGLAYQVYRSKKPALPIKSYDDLTAFKIYSLDVGLLRRLSGLAPGAIAEGNRLLVEFKGALTENYILESLVRQFEEIPRYWTSGNRAEVDFLIQVENNIIPVEVKSDENITGKSLTFYRKEFSPKLSIRYSLKNLKQDEGLLNIPLFMADYTDKLLTMI